MTILDNAKKLPVIRHIRYFIVMYRINRHYETWAKMGFVAVHAQSDYEHANRI